MSAADEFQPHCVNCKFFRVLTPNASNGSCHRYAPRGADSATQAMAEALIAIGWVLAKHHKQEDEMGDMDSERSPFNNVASFPNVELDDWCGEWSPSA